MTAKKKAKLEISDWELLQSLQDDLRFNLKAKELGKKLSDLLKIVELKYKIKDESQKEKIFWELVENLRKEVLENSESRKHEVLNHEGTKKRKNNISMKNSKQVETEESETNR